MDLNPRIDVLGAMEDATVFRSNLLPARLAVMELLAAAADYAHLEACAYNSMDVIAGRKRLLNAIARVRGEV